MDEKNNKAAAIFIAIIMKSYRLQKEERGTKPILIIEKGIVAMQGYYIVMMAYYLLLTTIIKRLWK